MAAASILTDVLRILTPEEISELTTSSSSSNRVELTDLLNQFEDGDEVYFGEVEDEGGAKILPFNAKKEVDETPAEDEIIYSAGPAVCEYLEHYLKKLEMGNTAISKSGEKVETSVFILKEKERFKYVQSKLKQKEVMGLYMKNANVDIEQEKTLKDDLSKSSRSGVLINKKQF